MRFDLIIKRPLITEKSMGLAQEGKFSFEVLKKANKYQIAQAIAKVFNVEVVGIVTSVIKGKEKRFGARRMPAKSSDSKKAIIKLKKGQKIDLFELKEEKK
jgi:large subunit ribosomal protein L23